MWLINSLFFFANILFCASYAVRDILWLRLLSVVATFCLLPYFIIGPKDFQLGPVIWQTVFLLINGYNLCVLFRNRRIVPLTLEQERLRLLVFPGMSPRQLLRFLSVAEWKTAQPQERLVAAGEHIDDLLVIYSGQAEVRHGGELIATLRDGQFIGEMSFVTHEPTSADVFATSELRYVCWDKQLLAELFEAEPTFHQAVHSVLGQDLVRKLRQRGRPAPQG